jgi:UDPglucose 6-dehydrogenase
VQDRALTRQVCVIGAGYVGLITGVGLAGLGHHVEIVETRPDRLAALRAGVVPIHEPGVEARLQDHLAQGSIEVASSPSAGADVVMVCVGTPIDASGESDLSQVESALASVRLVADQRTVIIVRSTLPPGSSRLVSQWSGVERTRVLLNPEFLRQGTALTDFEHPTRIVLGHYPDADSDAIQIALSLFEPITAPRLVVDIPTAELIKNGANAFLALRLSFANEMAALCEAYGAEAGSVLEGIGLDPRIGSSYMRPSFGFGGSCLPKELMAITRAGTRRG